VSAAERERADYIDRTIATIRNHQDADNVWPQWANVLADEVETLRTREQQLEEQVEGLRTALAAYRSALRSGEPESERLRAHGDAALTAQAETKGEK
jgi:uncharacterized protein YlxW (UPF0749 family)